MQRMDYIDEHLYLLGETLYDGQTEIRLGQGRHGRILRFLYDHAGEVFSSEELYRNCIRQNIGEVDYTTQVNRVCGALRSKHEKLRACILSPKKDYYTFCLPLRLKPDEASGVPTSYIRRNGALEALMGRAFSDGNRFLICGEPGIGKTELARDFARQCTQMPRLYRHVFTVRYEQNLRHTLTAIRTEGETKQLPQYAEFLDKLQELRKQGQILLIVDNMDITAEAFAGDQQVLQDLEKAKIHVLFTGRNALDVWFGGACLELKPMEPDRLRFLFCDVARGACTEPPQRVERLIREGLGDNTYLTVLSAMVLRRLGSFDLLERALLTDGAMTLRETVASKKDETFRTGTLMEHFKALYTMGELDRDQKALMSALCLIPAGGMDRRLFLDRAGGTGEKRVRMERAMAELEDSFWVLRSGEDISLHPMVRELVLEDPVVGWPMRNYAGATARALYSREYEANLISRLKTAERALTVIRRRKLKVPEEAFLAAQIASTWDTLTDYPQAFTWGKEALPLLDTLEQGKEDLHWLALCYNVVGYGLNHTRTEEGSCLAKKALDTAEALVKKGLEQPGLTPEGEEELLVLGTKVRSNLAARYLAAGACEEAVLLHKQVLAERERLWQRYGKDDYRDLVAVSLKNIGTAQFHLLMDSTDNHRRAMDFYGGEEVRSESYYIAFHRYLGSQLRALELCDDREIRRRWDCDRKEKLLQLLLRQRDALKELVETLPLAGEIRNGYENTCRILFQAQQKGIYSGEMQDTADQIWSLQYRLPKELSEELREKIRTDIHPALLLLDKLR